MLVVLPPPLTVVVRDSSGVHVSSVPEEVPVGSYNMAELNQPPHGKHYFQYSVESYALLCPYIHV